MTEIITDARAFIGEQLKKIKKIVGDQKAIGFVSGGVDSVAVAVMASRALGKNFLAIVVETGLMREGEIAWVKSILKENLVPCKVVAAADLFFDALKGKILPLDKRIAVQYPFYDKILPQEAQSFSAQFVFQGTNDADIKSTTPHSKAPQHNVITQVGKKTSLEIIEPLVKLRKPSIREVAKELELPESVWKRMPFPGPALAVRILGEVTPGKVEIIRKVTAVVEEKFYILKWRNEIFQYFPVLISDCVPSHDRDKLGYAVAIVCFDSKDAITAEPTIISSGFMTRITERIYKEVPEVFRVCWDFSSKPPASMEWQ